MTTYALPYPPSVAGIYKITDAPTGRVYYGSAVSLRRRWGYHQYRLGKGTHPNPILQAIWNSDSNRLVFAVLMEMPAATKAELLRAEQDCLDAARVGDNRNCMNVLKVAGSHMGAHRSAETKARLSSVFKGRQFSEATKQKMREAKLGRPLTEGHKKKIGDAHRGRPCNRPVGIINHRLRRWTVEEVTEYRALRASGWSWRKLADYAGAKTVGVVRRAVIGETYKDAR